MNIEPVVHHHFKLSQPIIETPEKCRHISFESIPLFKLYKSSSLDQIRSLVESLIAPMPHDYQKNIYDKIRPKYKEEARHRQDLIPMKYCVHNKQSFFVRAYYLRQNGGLFFKVEIVLHSRTLGEGKYYTWDKAYRASLNFFDILDARTDPFSPLDNHLPEFFYPAYFSKEVSLLQNLLDTVRDSAFHKERIALIEALTDRMSDFQNNAKDNSLQHINSLSQELRVQANLLDSR